MYPVYRNDEDILNTIYQNSRMAFECTKRVIRRCRSKELREYLKLQKNRYSDSCREARTRLVSGGAEIRPVPVIQSAMARMGIFMKTAFDRRKGHIAELMYDGTNMGIIDIARSVNHSKNASPETIQLAEALMKKEEKYANGLRKFL